jgi:hypothetical protein
MRPPSLPRRFQPARQPPSHRRLVDVRGARRLELVRPPRGWIGVVALRILADELLMCPARICFPAFVSVQLITHAGSVRPHRFESDRAGYGALFRGPAPSVVHIAVKKKPTKGPNRADNGEYGSAFLWDAEGHVITNAHVVRGATAINVVLPAGRLVAARGRLLPAGRRLSSTIDLSPFKFAIA